MWTPLQIVVTRNQDDRGTDVYIDTLRLAFEGSSAPSSSPSAYLDDSVDLGIRVLEPARDIEGHDLDRLLNGARHTVALEIGDGGDLAEKLEPKIGSGNFVRVVSPLPPQTAELQGGKPADGVEPALAPVVTALRVMETSRRVLADDVSKGDDPKENLKLFISHAKTMVLRWRDR